MYKKMLFIFSSLLLVAACGQNKYASTTDANESTKKLEVMTTLYPLADFTKKIGGTHVEVESILPPGADAHTFEPTPKTMIKLADSDLFIYMGAGLEGFAESAAKTLKDGEVELIEASEGVTFEVFQSNHGHEHNDHDEEETQQAEEKHDDHGDVDPHVWLDPILAIDLADHIKSELIQAKPEAKDDFERNFLDLKKKLEELDRSYQQMVEQAERKEILVSHAAYGYWEHRYGIEQISVSGLSPTNEPTQQQMKEIIEETREYNIQYILFEQNVSTKPAETIKKHLNLDILYLHNLSVLTEEDIENKEDYFTLMERNQSTLKKALSH
ncbi:metal ABC transporter solute-binding protein, Zn/Mn family [Pseudalkalibacillus berkeleyi]|uniref:Zinc ABC transporter substrate-binding protein n=1 Tax=Pseudalkalibacillus berkeleyi TaxID=1069813 RepID=A0ABS9GXM1_9BACL|nr:zinc ABC transporter substrate-binding protein [Pseudalkalibacillus berkeleyi]MCF6136355.1 zinc ABC transporter substrate-binding protein [Pseudalkalibacillus berkeleyi]